MAVIQGAIRMLDRPRDGGIEGATVVANGPHGARSTVTDASGFYKIEFLDEAVYDVTAVAPGFQAATQREVKLSSLTTTLTVNLMLPALVEETPTPPTARGSLAWLPMPVKEVVWVLWAIGRGVYAKLTGKKLS